MAFHFNQTPSVNVGAELAEINPEVAAIKHAPGKKHS